MGAIQLLDEPDPSSSTALPAGGAPELHYLPGELTEEQRQRELTAWAASLRAPPQWGYLPGEERQEARLARLLGLADGAPAETQPAP